MVIQEGHVRATKSRSVWEFVKVHSHFLHRAYDLGLRGHVTMEAAPKLLQSPLYGNNNHLMTFHWATWHQKMASFFLEDYDNRELLNQGAVCCKDMLIIFK